jgi:phosphomannomutase
VSASTEASVRAPAIKFGTDGWRGIIAEDFTFAGVRAAALGIARYIKHRHTASTVVVGHDTRFASDRFARELAAVLEHEGVHALLIDDPAPTQVISWTVVDRGAAGGVVITSSHNPSEFNGLKYKPDFGGSAPTDVVEDLERRINEVLETEPPVRSRLAEVNLERIDPRDSYGAQIGRMLDLKALKGAGLRILADAMHGAGGRYLETILSGGATSVTTVRADPDPMFGGVHPEPIAVNLGVSLERMRATPYDLGIATDGDADRVGIIDESAGFVNQLQVYALLMFYLLEVRGERGPVVRTLTSTSMADRLGELYGVPVHEVKVGFKYVGPEMMRTSAIMGGEESGGFGFRRHIPERDGILAGLFIADMIMRREKPLSDIWQEITERVGPHFYDRIDVHLPRDGYATLRERVYAHFREHLPQSVAGRRVVRHRDDDGFKLYLEGGDWVLVRGSGTEPMLRIYSEAGSPEVVASLLDEMGAQVEELI